MYKALNKLDATHIQLAQGDIVTAEVWNNLNRFYINQGNAVVDVVNILQTDITRLEERYKHLGIYYGTGEAPDWAYLQIVPTGDEGISLITWRDALAKLKEVTDDVRAALESGELNGRSGVYVGTGDMPADCNVQIDPSGEALQPEDVRAKPIATTRNYQDFLLYKEDYSKHAVLLLSASGRNSLGNVIEFTIPITLLGDTYSVNAAVPVYDFEGGIKEFVRCFCSLPHATKANSGCDEPWVFSKETQEPVYRLFGL